MPTPPLSPATRSAFRALQCNPDAPLFTRLSLANQLHRSAVRDGMPAGRDGAMWTHDRLTLEGVEAFEGVIAAGRTGDEPVTLSRWHRRLRGVCHALGMAPTSSALIWFSRRSPARAGEAA